MGCTKSTQSNQNKILKQQQISQQQPQISQQTAQLEPLQLHRPYKFDEKAHRFEINELFKLVRNGDYNFLDWNLKYYKIENIFALRGFSRFEKQSPNEFPSPSQDQTLWNMLLIGIYYKQEKIVQYFLQQFNCNLKILLRNPVLEQANHVQWNTDDEIYGLKMAIFNQDMTTFEQLWQVKYRWNFEHFQCILEYVFQDIKKYKNFIKFFIRSEASKEIMSDLSGFQSDQFAEKYLLILKNTLSEKSKENSELAAIIMDIFKQAKDQVIQILVRALNDQQVSDSEKQPLYSNIAGNITREIVREYKPKDHISLIQDLELIRDFESTQADQQKQVRDTINSEILQLKELVNAIDPIKYMLVYQKGNIDLETSEWLMYAVYEAYQIDGQQIMGKPYIMIEELIKDNRDRKAFELSLKYLDHDHKHVNRRLLQICYEQNQNELQFIDMSPVDLIKICVVYRYNTALEALLSFNELWDKKQLSILGNYIQTHSQTIKSDQAQIILNSPCVKSYLQSISFAQRKEILSEYLNLIQQGLFQDSLINAYLLEFYLVKSNFFQCQNFDLFEDFIKNMDLVILQQFCQQNQELINKFITLISFSNFTSVHYQYGSQFLKKISIFPEWKSVIENQDNESRQFEDFEDEIDESQIKLNFKVTKTIEEKKHSQQQTQMIQKIDGDQIDQIPKLKELFDIMSREDEVALMRLLSGNRSLETLFIKAKTDQTVEIYTTISEESEDVRYDSLNLVQLAAATNLSDTMIGYFLKEHQIKISSNIYKNVPGAILILNNNEKFEEGASMILRILISWGRMIALNSLLEGYKGLWTSHNLLVAMGVLIAREEDDFLCRILDMSVTMDVFQNASQTMRNRFITLMESCIDTNLDYVHGKFVQGGYLEKLKAQVYNNQLYLACLADDEELLENELLTLGGVGDIIVHLQNREKLPNIKIDGKDLDQNKLNIVLLCILFNSYKSLDLIFKKYPQCIRESLKGDDTSDLNIQLNGLKFDTLGVALLSQSKNLNILRVLLKQESFVISPNDLKSLIESFVNLKHFTGIQELLKSLNIQMCFASMDYEQDMKPFVMKFWSEDKYKLYTQLVLYTPYLSTAFALVLQNLDVNIYFKNELTKRCLSQLSRDDFEIIYHREKDLINASIQNYLGGQAQVKVEDESERNIKFTLQRFQQEYLNHITQ
eukprot:403349396